MAEFSQGHYVVFSLCAFVSRFIVFRRKLVLQKKGTPEWLRFNLIIVFFKIQFQLQFYFLLQILISFKPHEISLPPVHKRSPRVLNWGPQEANSMNFPPSLQCANRLGLWGGVAHLEKWSCSCDLTSTHSAPGKHQPRAFFFLISCRCIIFDDKNKGAS